MADFSQTLFTWNEMIERESAGEFEPGRTYRSFSSRGTDDGYQATLAAPSLETPEKNASTNPTRAPWAEYEISSEIGRGGMGIVYSARQTKLHRDVALKKAMSSEGQTRFSNEAVITGALEHPNIVTVYDLIEAQNGEVGMAMKLIRGRSWEAHLQADWAETDTLSEERLNWHLDVLYKVCQATAYAHSQNVLHNDLKPDNVMVGEYGEVALMDWGCASGIPGKKPNPLPVLRSERLLSPFGTPSYMAPEQALGRGPDLNSWTDTYLLGAILYRIVEGIPIRRGTDLQAVIRQAAEGSHPPMTKCSSSRLRALCTKALQKEPKERFQTVDDLLNGLASYQKTSESEKLSRTATSILNRSLSLIEQQEHSAERVLVDLAEAVYAFQQALILWSENPSAVSGLQQARVALIDYAIRQGDLKLAAAHIEHLGLNKAAERCASDLQRAITNRDASERQARRNRVLLDGAILLVIAVLIVGGILVKSEQRKTDLQRSRAERHLHDLQELSDTQRVRKQIETQRTLWPSVPKNVEAMKEWIAGTEALLDKTERHQSSLEKIDKTATLSESGERVFEKPTDEWEYVTLQELLEGLEQLRIEELPRMRARLQDASTIENLTLKEPVEAWREAIEQIAASSKYSGLVIEPQLGLIPLGPDPQSGLWEFAHVQSGELPTRDDLGRLLLPDDPCIVLVLLPGGRFDMGAQALSDQPDVANFDPRATSIEMPVHPVELEPFFLAKYEMTQGQWLRIMGDNPSAYPAGREVGDHEKKTITIRNPVEQITWSDSAEALRRLDLTLPTEAQWEYGSRAGTQTVYWTGDTVSSLQGTLNIADLYCEENGGPGSWKYERELYDGFVAHAPVGQFKPNPFGLHDTAGNVWEWCRDRFGSYEQPTAPKDGARLNTTLDAPRVFRGGGFRAASVHARSADRYTQYATDYRGYDVGLRAARTLRAGNPLD